MSLFIVLRQYSLLKYKFISSIALNTQIILSIITSLSIIHYIHSSLFTHKEGSMENKISSSVLRTILGEVHVSRIQVSREKCAPFAQVAFEMFYFYFLYYASV